MMLEDLQFPEQRTNRNEMRTEAGLSIKPPINKIPHEILANIFMQYSGPTVCFPPTREPSAWSLGHVCALWRQVLWEFPLIWGDLYVRAPTYNFWRGLDACSKEGTRQSLNYILSRTNIRLSLFCNHEEVAFISDIIISHHHRFRSLEFYNISTMTLSLFLDLPSVAFPSLEKFVIVFQGPPFTNAPSSLRMAPNLKYFHYKYYADGPTPQMYSIPPWNQLTDITLDNVEITTSTIHTALQHFVNLVTCRALLTAGAVVPNTIPKILPNLESLHIELGRTQIDWEFFLRHFSFPSLTSLHINSILVLGPLGPFTHLIIRSGCLLENLTLTSYTLGGADLQSFELVHHLPEVETLRLSYLIPASAIRNVLDGLCPWLMDVVWNVDPEGLEAIMDWVDGFTTKSSSELQHINEESFCIRIPICRENPGYTRARRRYLAGENLYKHWMRFDQGYRYYEDVDHGNSLE